MAFTDQQKAALSAKLDAGHVKTRDQAGRKLSYIEGWHAIAEANRIFGFDGWSRETVETTCVWSGERTTKNGAMPAASYIAKVRVTVGNIVREGTGAGSGFGKDHGEAHESAIKEAETDAMKRSLMTFGNPFGLALYDKEQAEVERNGNGHAAQKPADEPPEREQARKMYATVKAGIDAATHAGDAALGLKVDGKDREDIAFIRKWGGNVPADSLHTLAAHKIASLTKRNAA